MKTKAEQDIASEPSWQPGDPVVVVPHSGNLNRAQRRSQSRYKGFEDAAPKSLRTAPMIIRRSGKNRWTRNDRAKLSLKWNGEA